MLSKKHSKLYQLYNTLVTWVHIHCVDKNSACITAAWKDFKQLLPIIINCCILLSNWGDIFSSCIKQSFLYGCKAWPAYSKNICCLTSADNDMDIRLEQRFRTQELNENVGINSVTKEIRRHRVRNLGHLLRMYVKVCPRSFPRRCLQFR